MGQLSSKLRTPPKKKTLASHYIRYIYPNCMKIS